MNKFLSRFEAENLRKTVIYIGIAVFLIAISLWIGLTDNFLTIAMLIIGIGLFFYAALYLWEKPAYYAILAVICLITLILLFIWPNKRNMNEAIAWIVGFVSLGGIIAGFIGALRFRKYD